MTENLASHIEYFVQFAPVWGLLLIFVFMTIESSFVPFPSEIVMIPAGFLAMRGEMTFHCPWLDLVLAFVFGLAGSMAGAWINYFLAARLGEPILRRYGKYIFIKPDMLDRSQEIFRKYGDMATFVCRLLPAIRQLISLPAGLAKMPPARFSFFTALGAGVWCIVLLAIGGACGAGTQDMSYEQMVVDGKAFIADHYLWILLVIAVFIAVYLGVQKAIFAKSLHKEMTGNA